MKEYNIFQFICREDNYGVIITDMMKKLGFDQPTYDADQMLQEIADVVPFFKGVTRERLGKLGLQWPL